MGTLAPPGTARMEEEPKAEAAEAAEPEPEPSSSQLDILNLKSRIQLLSDRNLDDFDAWVSLIRATEETSANDIEVISLVYHSFLLKFPLCYGYWIKYASHKARLCTCEEVVEVYEQAVQAVPHSVDLWVSYCGFGVCAYEDPAHIRRLFERALSLVGKDYLCCHLWDKYIAFENSQKHLIQLATIYINTLKFPTKKLHQYYESFRKLVTLMEQEFTHCGTERSLENLHTLEIIDFEESGGDISTKITGLFERSGGHLRADAVKQYFGAGEHLYQRSSKLDKEICCFEASIKRHFFHLKPLDGDQLENWHRYLDFVEKNKDFDWAVKLYERCLIPCANYSEFWIRYAEFVDSKGGREIANYALGRASSCFVKGVPTFRMYYAMFKEQIGDASGARSLFSKGSTNLTSDFYMNINRLANMEKRMGNTKAASELYEKAIQDAMQKPDIEILPDLYTNFAQFKYAVSHSISDAKEVFVQGIKQAPCKPLIKGFMQFISTHGGPTEIPILDSFVADAVTPGSDVSAALSPEDRKDISLLFLEFVDLHGSISELRKAWARHSKMFPCNTRNLSQRYCTTENSLQQNNKRRRTECLIGSQDDSREDTTTSKLLSENDTCSLLVDKVVEPAGDRSIVVSGKGHTDAEEQNILGNVDVHQEVGDTVQECINLSQNHCLDESGIQNQMNSLANHETSHDLSLCEQNDQTTESHPAVSELAPQDELCTYDSPSKSFVDSKEIDAEDTIEVSANVHQGTVCPSSDSPSVASLPKEGSPSDPVQISPELEEKQHDEIQVKLETEYDASVSNANLEKSSDSPGAAHRASEISAPNQDIQPSRQQQLPVSAKSSSSEMPTTQTTTSSQFSPNTAVIHQAQLQNQNGKSEMYQSNNLTLAGQNMQQQQSLSCEIPQNAQTSSQTQAQPFAQPNQGNQQYPQMMQGYASQMWQYYQQQVYYLQAQHNQQIQTLQQQQLPTEHLQQNFMQQVQQLNQQMALWQQQVQQQQQQQQQHALRVQQQPDNPSSGDTKHDQNKQQNQSSQMDNQSQHVQQQQLLYFQQQQQMYQQQQQQQQQLVQQQQQYLSQMPQRQQDLVQQQQLFQQQQQQLVQQQQQQMVLLQQQQQQFIQQQMQQYLQQQTNQLGPKYQNLESNPQNARSRQMDHGQQSEASQSDGSKLRSGEQSELSYPSTPQSQRSNH